MGETDALMSGEQESDETTEKEFPSIWQKLDKFWAHQDERVLGKGEILRFNIEAAVRRVALFLQEKSGLDDKSIAAEVDGYTFYNSSKKMVIEGQSYIIVRGESIKREDDSVILFFKIGEDGLCELDEQAPILSGQDPFGCGVCGDESVIGEVATYRDKNKISPEHPDGNLCYRTVFYKFKDSIYELKGENNSTPDPFAVGPEGMKDIRLIERSNGKIGVFIRPQGTVGFFGKIGYCEVDNINELQILFDKLDKINYPEDPEFEQVKAFLESIIIEGLCYENEWVGANDLELLEDSAGKEKIGVVGHIAHVAQDPKGRMDPDKPDRMLMQKNYYGMSFIFDPDTKKKTPMEIILTAENFDKVEPKDIRMGSVNFIGGLDFKANETADCYAGVNDAAQGRALIANPFKGYKRITKQKN